MGRRFLLSRAVDVSGVSGTGIVAHGIEFADGSCAMRWSSGTPCTSVWSSVADMIAVHGHNGATRVEWVD